MIDFKISYYNVDLNTIQKQLNDDKKKINEIMKGKINDGNIPELWDGKASNRIVKVISAYFK